MSPSSTVQPAVIFDLDGTLVDSLADLTYSLNAALADAGLPVHGAGAVRAMVGDGARVLVQRAVGPANLARVDEVLEGFKLHYDVHCLDATELYPGLASSLDALVAAGWHLAVLSNKPEDFSRRCVAALMSHWPIAAIVGGRDNLPRKPDPAGALEIAATLGRNPRDMYMVGDSPTDVATGKAAGMVPVAATWGFRDRDVLVDSGPALLVDHPAELAQILIAHRAAFAR